MNKIGEQLIKDLQLEKLPPEEQAVVIEKFSDTLFQAVLIRGLEVLTDEQKDALDLALKNNPDAGQDIMMDFFMTNIPNFESVVSEETKRLQEKIADVVGGAR